MKLEYPFKGCGEIASVVDSSTINCGELDPFTNETLYCRKCLTARVNYLQDRLLSSHCDSYETMENTEEDIKRRFKCEAANWSRQCTT